MAVRLHLAADREGVGEIGASLIRGLLRQRPDAIVGLATGSSPLPVYKALVRASPDFDRAKFVALDEYVGLPGGHPNSYHHFLVDHLLGPLGIDAARLVIPDGGAADSNAAAQAFERRLEKIGPVDLQILGIGSNGHLGFNEPPARFASRCHVVALADRTRADNARFFEPLAEVPERAITQGLGNIREARSLMLIASGKDKAEPVARALEGPVSEAFPASMLQLHPNVAVILDEAAASRLTARTGDMISCAS